jgi:hypothetical protein
MQKAECWFSAYLKNVLRVVHAEATGVRDEVWQHEPAVVVRILCNYYFTIKKII